MTVTHPISWPSRTSTVRFELRDAHNARVTDLALDAGSPPQLSSDHGRSTPRRLTGLRIPRRGLVDRDSLLAFADDVNPLTMSVVPYWSVGGTEYPLGRYFWADDSEAGGASGELADLPRFVEMVDRTEDLDQPLDRHYSVQPNLRIDTAVRRILDLLAINERAVETHSGILGPGTVTGSAGRDSWLGLLEQIHTAAGWLPPHFNNDGEYVGRSTPDLETAPATITYDDTTENVVLGSLVTSSDMFRAPNRYIAIDTSATDAPIVGRYDVPASAPHSFANTQRRRVRTVEVPGLESIVAANNAARAAYNRDPTAHTWATWDSPIDPRHDSFDVVQVGTTKYLETGWAMSLLEGSPMRHEAQGTFG